MPEIRNRKPHTFNPKPNALQEGGEEDHPLGWEQEEKGPKRARVIKPADEVDFITPIPSTLNPETSGTHSQNTKP